MKKLVIFGNKNFAEMVYYQFTEDSEYQVVAFTVDREYLEVSEYKNVPVIAYDELDQHFDKSEIEIFVAIGINKLNQLRENSAKTVKEDGYKLASFVSSRAVLIGPVEIKENVMIMEGVFVHPNTTIGRNCILWSGTIIAMNNRIGDNCWITSAKIGERCIIGDNTFIGLNASISPKLKVGKYNVIGAGGLIVKDTKDEEVYKGAKSPLSRVLSSQLARFSVLK